MPYQLNSTCCSAASMQLCLSVLGTRIGQHKLSKIILNGDDGADGADEQDVLLALGSLGCSIDIFESSRRRDAEQWLKLRAFDGPLMLCVDNWGHWVSVCGGCAKKLWLFDPDPTPWNTSHNGAWPLGVKTILKRWKAARGRKRDGGLYYGIAILSCDPAVAKRCTAAAASD